MFGLYTSSFPYENLSRSKFRFAFVSIWLNFIIMDTLVYYTVVPGGANIFPMTNNCKDVGETFITKIRDGPVICTVYSTIVDVHIHMKADKMEV